MAHERGDYIRDDMRSHRSYGRAANSEFYDAHGTNTLEWPSYQQTRGMDRDYDMGYDRDYGMGYDRDYGMGYGRDYDMGYDRDYDMGYDRDYDMSYGSNTLEWPSYQQTRGVDMSRPRYDLLDRGIMGGKGGIGY